MSISRTIANLYWRISKWNPATTPAPDQGVVLGAPHTSNWDFILMLVTGWRMGLKFKWLGKNSMFRPPFAPLMRALGGIPVDRRSEEHTSELQSRGHLVCRLLLEKKKNKI